MPREKQPQSFERTTYPFGSDPRGKDRLDHAPSVIKQSFSEIERDSPACGLVLALQGENAKISCHSYEMFVPERARAVEERAWKTIDAAAKRLQRDCARRGLKLRLTRVKGSDGSASQKVSMNERYYTIHWRTYRIELP